MSIPRAQAIILKQLQRQPAKALPWHELGADQQLKWLRKKPGVARKSSENHPMFAAASQALAGHSDAREFWNLLSAREFMGIELGVSTVYSTWHWNLWAVAAEGFSRHGWNLGDGVGQTLEYFALVSALSAEVTAGKYSGGELSHLRGAFSKGDWLCLPWGKRGFSRPSKSRTGPATHVWHNVQGWMLAKACRVPSSFTKNFWEKDCLAAIGNHWHRLPQGVIGDIRQWVDKRSEVTLKSLLLRIADLRILRPDVLFERSTQGLAVWAPKAGGTGNMGTQPTLGASYLRNSPTLHVLTAGDGRRSGQPPAFVEEEEQSLRRIGGAPTEASLPTARDWIPKPAGETVARFEIRRHRDQPVVVVIDRLANGLGPTPQESGGVSTEAPATPAMPVTPVTSGDAWSVWVEARGPINRAIELAPEELVPELEAVKLALNRAALKLAEMKG